MNSVLEILTPLSLSLSQHVLFLSILSFYTFVEVEVVGDNNGDCVL